ncbi:hypothetical protein SPRG_17989 [Saprolegnia parasitica CBS 223.65]|uniref:Uncharacterized protein n=1 Tax=Saprolegnia parasitica (strain CBS 223.65) TaxID=695850 RepID=A0A067BP57_SAPPC|nr:hypothetical protein SPRG_17989 [Saprolegnia parasitica CBS 223.65]KDO16487.1 hypothetical protein SPRG_17989 [Saprolegnia parasitica CBS 223.65]|eukprot:XP_012212805.1 hypothetical protein SPRG_17989 [Saprolegnia parasitica CBS 223.65]
MDLDNKLRVHTIEVDTASPRHDHPRKCSAYQVLFSSPQGGYGDMVCNQSPNLQSFRLDKFTGEARCPGLGSLFADHMVQFDAAVHRNEFFHCTTWTDEHIYHALKTCLGPEPADWDDQVFALMRKAKRYGDTWALHAHYTRNLPSIIPSSTVLDIFCSYACPEHLPLLLGHIDERRRNDAAMLDELVQRLPRNDCRHEIMPTARTIESDAMVICAKCQDDDKCDAKRCNERCAKREDERRWNHEHCYSRDVERQVEQRDDDDPRQDNQTGDDDQHDDKAPRQNNQDQDDTPRDDATNQDDAKRQSNKRRDERRYRKDDCMSIHADLAPRGPGRGDHELAHHAMAKAPAGARDDKGNVIAKTKRDTISYS